MPSFAWLKESKLPKDSARPKLMVMQKLGVPYSNGDIDTAEQVQRAQAEAVVTDLAGQSISLAPDSEMVALISYLQRLGRAQGVPFDGSKTKVAGPVPAGEAQP